MISEYLPKVVAFLLILSGIAIAIVYWGKGRLPSAIRLPGSGVIRVVDRQIINAITLLVVDVGHSRVLIAKSGPALSITSLSPGAWEQTKDAKR